jgi:hypothetical protein
MSQNAGVIALGATRSSDKDVTSFPALASSFPAGTAVRAKSDGGLTVTKAQGSLVGVSIGKSLVLAGHVEVVRSGMQVPILLTDDEDDYSYVVVGQKVWVDDVTGHANIVDDGDVTTTVTDAIYVSGPIDGLKADGTTVKVALIDFPGGL